MSIQIRSRVSRDRQKTWYSFEWGKGPGERRATGMFTYAMPKNEIQENYNKEILALLEVVKHRKIIECHSTGTAYISNHLCKDNFLDYYSEFVEKNQRPGNRCLQGSLTQFKLFIKKPGIHLGEITEGLTMGFRDFLTDRLTGETTACYFRAFNRVLKSATDDGYFRISPAEEAYDLALARFATAFFT